MSQREEPFPRVFLYGGSTAASMASAENSSARPDALASIVRDAVTLYCVGVIRSPADAEGPADTALQPSCGSVPEVRPPRCSTVHGVRSPEAM